MQLNRIISYTQKAIALGPRATLRVVHNKMQSRLFYAFWRNRALRKTAGHHWQLVADRLGVAPSFDGFFYQLQQRAEPTFLRYLIFGDVQHVIKYADTWVQGTPTVLGGQIRCDGALPWHEDFRLKELNPDADCTFSSQQFYLDIVIEVGRSGESLTKDIKVPWELSRFQHILFLGQAYRSTQDERYVQTFMSHVDDWITRNPYMLGVNWVCPMEVGLRALNWIIAFWYFRHAEAIPKSFWQKMISSLYDHAHYLENNWELYDGRTSNHYLSDLVGYLYLCFFFRNNDAFRNKGLWCFAHIEHEMRKQVFHEGASYEGSTAYHRLVTELFLHAYMLARELQLEISDYFQQCLAKMLRFIAWCSPKQDILVTIGDHDSGQVTAVGITRAMQSLVPQVVAVGTHTFSEFGISVIKNTVWHVTLRHHAYQKKQPSGHFHNDAGSVTLAVHGIPVLIDPGSYVYTPSVFWRNYFRSASMHNTVTLRESSNPVVLDDHLFKLDMQEACIVREHAMPISTMLKTVFRVGSCGGDVICTRSVTRAYHGKKLLLTDVIHGLERQGGELASLEWNFILAPDIAVQPVSEHQWLFSHHGKALLTMCSQLPLECVSTWSSPAYGVKVATHTLRGIYDLAMIKKENLFYFSFVLE